VPRGAARASGASAPGIHGSVFFLTTYIVLLFFIPSRLVVGPLGSIGSPALLWGVAGAFWWGWALVSREEPEPLIRRPVRRAMFFFAGTVLASSVVAMSRPINDMESSTNEAGVITLISWLGVFLLAHDGPGGRAALDVLVRRLTVVGAVVAVLGILQFATGHALTNLIQIPGLSTNVDLVSVRDRSGFARPSGTAIHPIEFGTTMVMLLPLAVHVALHGHRSLGPVHRWWPVAAIGLAIPLSVSRSAFVGLVIVLAVMAPTWSPRGRAAAAAVVSVATLMLFVTVPGFLGTILNLFASASGDSSVLSRSDSYDLALEFVGRAPWFGRGFLTFLPQYRILDNQYLGTLIDTGLFGMVALLALFVVGIVVSASLSRRAPAGAERSLGVAFFASTTASTVSFAFFDAFSFPQMAGTTFLVLGLVGSALRLRDLAVGRIPVVGRSGPKEVPGLYPRGTS
jgi:hypothetical protein